MVASQIILHSVYANIFLPESERDGSEWVIELKENKLTTRKYEGIASKVSLLISRIISGLTCSFLPAFPVVWYLVVFGLVTTLSLLNFLPVSDFTPSFERVCRLVYFVILILLIFLFEENDCFS